MFNIEQGWRGRYRGAVLPSSSAAAGWSVGHSTEPFVEPGLKIVHGDPTTAKVFVVAAPGAVGKSTYARALSAATSSALVDLAKTEPLGGNFFVGGIANAFGYDALSDFQKGTLGLIVDALDEAQLRSGAEGFAAGLLDLGKVIQHPDALPVVLFGRSSAADEAWLILSSAGLEPCLLEIEFFDEPLALEYIQRKLPLVAARRRESESAYGRHADTFKKLATATRSKLIETPGGNDRRFAGYAPVLDAICSFAIEEGGQNPAGRAVELSAKGPVALVDEIAKSILQREQTKLLYQLRESGEVPNGYSIDELYLPQEQLEQIACVILGIPKAVGPKIDNRDLQEAYDRMVKDFAPQHPFLNGQGHPSNVAFAAYVLVWCITTGFAADAARSKLVTQPRLSSGMLFELYMHWLDGAPEEGAQKRRLALADVGPLYASLASQTSQGEAPMLEVLGDEGESTVDVEFEVTSHGDADRQVRSFGPFPASSDSLLELRSPLGNVRIVAPISMIIGDGKSVSVTAPVEIDIDVLEVDGNELRAFRSTGSVAQELQQISLVANDASVGRVDRVIVHGGRLAVTFPGMQSHPWTEYATVPPAPPNDTIGILRRRMRRVLTAFRSHSKGALVRLAAKIDHERMMKKDNLGPRLVEMLVADGILERFDAGKFYQLHQDRMAALLKMDYQAIQQQRWTPDADEYLGRVGG